MKAIRSIVFLALLTGCGTLNNSYRPAVVGPVDSCTRVRDLAVVLVGTQEAKTSRYADRVRLGEPVHFSVVLKNVGTNDLWVPKNPEILFSWIYPDGQRDNHLREIPKDHFYQADDVVLLKPGQSLKQPYQLKTWFFRKTGIVEFRAIVQISRNTNRDLPAVWSGRVVSNGYGILVERPHQPPPCSTHKPPGGSNKSARHSPLHG